jgi:hypothetical protein
MQHLIGVSWRKATSAWCVMLSDPQIKRQRYIGCYEAEEDAARAYDCAAVQALGSGAERNFPGEVISELPVTVGEEQKQRSSSRYKGVIWDKASSSWNVRLWLGPQAKRNRYVGSYASEEDAARAFDCAAVQAHGPGAKRNFPGEAICEMPVRVGEERQEERKQRTSSRYMGVTWHKGSSSHTRACAALGPPDQARPVHWILYLRRSRSAGIRLCGCAGARTRRQAQLPW